jgi:hypothetical protein
MPTADLTREKIELNDGLDSIVVVQAISQIPGGRTLDVSGLAADVVSVKSGHVLVIDTKTKAVSPLAISDGAYVTLPTGKKYYGVLKASVLKRDPRAAIITAGQINVAASPAPVTDAIKAGLPHIQWLYE